jgi:hypothetical protein
MHIFIDNTALIGRYERCIIDCKLRDVQELPASEGLKLLIGNNDDESDDFIS